MGSSVEARLVACCRYCQGAGGECWIWAPFPPPSLVHRCSTSSTGVRFRKWKQGLKSTAVHCYVWSTAQSHVLRWGKVLG